MYPSPQNTVTFNRDRIDASDCYATALELVKRGWILYVIAGILLIVINMVPLVGVILAGPMAVGFQFLTLNDLRRGKVDLGDLFIGFKKFLPLVFLGLIVSLPSVLYTLVDLVLTVIDLATVGISLMPQPAADPNFFQLGDAELSTGPPPGITGLFALGAVAVWFVTVVWALFLGFALPIKFEHDTKMFDAIKLSFEAVWYNLGSMIVLIVFGMAAAILGVLAFCIGIFFAIPVILAANAIAYRMAFPNGDLENFNSVSGGGSGSLLGLND